MRAFLCTQNDSHAGIASDKIHAWGAIFLHISILDELTDALDRLEQADLDRAQRNLTPPEEQEVMVGTVHSDDCHRLWALQHKLEGDRAALLTRAAYQSNSNDETQVLKLDAARLGSLALLTMHIFWVRTYDELGSTAHQDAGNLRLRANYTVVRKANSHPLMEMLKQRFEGNDE